MKKKRNHIVSKVIGVVMLCILGTAVVFSTLGLMITSDTDSYYTSSQCMANMYKEMDDVMNIYSFDDFGLDTLEVRYNEENSNSRYTLEQWDENKKSYQVISTTKTGSETFGASVTAYYQIEESEDGMEIEWYSLISEKFAKSENTYRITIDVVDPITVVDDYYNEYQTFTFVSKYTDYYFPILDISLLLMVIILVYEIVVAGHRYEDGQLQLNALTSLPWDAVSVVTLFVLRFIGLDILSYLSPNSQNIWQTFFLTLGLMGVALVVYDWIITTAVQLKMRVLWKKTIICQIVSRGMDFLKMVPVVWGVSIGAVIYFVFSFYMTSAANLHVSTLYSLMYMFVTGVLCVLAIAGAFYAKKILDTSSEISKGNLDHKISENDLNHMHGVFRQHAENLNNIGAGLQSAVDEQMRSERLKAELITNVSHDIKTPLTSIINYVDLLQNQPDEEQRKQYLEVLERQSQRLKKLTEDVVEASKASTGNVTVNRMNTSIPEIMYQALGEYQEKLDQANLQMITNIPEELDVMTDGRLLWRVIRNLLSNVSKYSLENTRVYLDVIEKKDSVEIMMRNTSKEQLNISSQELLERFTRGDSSRHTEGSGLGLNIAQSLTELIGGTFTMEIDADLFKVKVSIPKETLIEE